MAIYPETDPESNSNNQEDYFSELSSNNEWNYLETILMEYDKSKKFQKNNSSKQINSKIKKSKKKNKAKVKPKDKGKENESSIPSKQEKYMAFDDIFSHSNKMKDILRKGKKRIDHDPFKETPKSSSPQEVSDYSRRTQYYIENIERQWTTTTSPINKCQISISALKKCEEHIMNMLKYFKKEGI